MPASSPAWRSTTFTVKPLRSHHLQNVGWDAIHASRALRAVLAVTDIPPPANEVASPRPPPSPIPEVHTLHTWRTYAPHLMYIRSTISAQSIASTPPAPAVMLILAPHPSYGPDSSRRPSHRCMCAGKGEQRWGGGEPRLQSSEGKKTISAAASTHHPHTRAIITPVVLLPGSGALSAPLRLWRPARRPRETPRGGPPAGGGGQP